MSENIHNLNGMFVELEDCPQCGRRDATLYTLPENGKHIIKMKCMRCRICWTLDDRTLVLYRGYGVVPSVVRYKVSHVMKMR